MKNFFILSLSFFSLLSPAVRAAEPPRLTFSQISTRDGLSQNTVRSILEDEKGFIWAGTLNGLNRYDGYNLAVYKPQSGKSPSLSDHRVKDIYRDGRGFLWIKTFNNEFSCYDPLTDSFLDYCNEPAAGNPPQYKNYEETASGDIWLWGNSGNCLRVRRENDRFVSETIETDEKETNTFLEDSKGGVWLGGDYGLIRIRNGETQRFYMDYILTLGIETAGSLYFTTQQSTLIEYSLGRGTFREIPCPEKYFRGLTFLGGSELMLYSDEWKIWVYNLADGSFSRPEWSKDPELSSGITLLSNPNGGVWAHNPSGIVWHYNPVGGKLRKMELIPPDIAAVIDDPRFKLFVDSEGLAWITTYGNGLFCYDQRMDRLYHYKYNPNQNSPASDYLLSITEDRSGNIWVGSEYAGIIKIVKSPYAVQRIFPEESGPLGKNNNVRSIFFDHLGNAWVGTKNGRLYLYDKNFTQGECLYRNLNSYDMVEDGEGQIWIATKGSGISVVDPKTRRITASYTYDSGNELSLSYNQVFSLLRDSKDRMWVGTFGRGLCLARQTPDGIAFDRFFHSLIHRMDIRHIFEDSHGRIWLATTNGLIRFIPEEFLADPENYTLFRLNDSRTGSINCNDIKRVFEDSRGRIWIGTAGGGISRYVEADAERPEYFIPHTLEDDPAGNLISGILEDRQGNLWIGTESGIYKFDPENGNFTSYLFSEKTYGNQFNENAQTIDSNDNMYWGTLDGLIIFNPDHFGSDEKNRPVTFTDFLIFDQKAGIGPKKAPLCRSVSYSDQVRLKHFQNTFTLKFSSLSFRDPAKNRYVYLLEHYDKKWSQPSGNNTATYKNLPPGRYTFRVKGTDTNGVWNDEVQRLFITIAPPWWKTTTAWIAYLLLFIGAAVMAMRIFLKFNTLNTNIRVEKELTNYKLRFFTNISHEFRTPLTIIRSVAENLDEQPDTSSYARRQIAVLNRNSNRLTQLIDQLLEFRKIQNNVLRLDLEEIDMVSFVRDIFQGFSEMAEKKEIGYSFVCRETCYRMFVDRRKMDKVIYNLLSNAFKFTPAGRTIEVRLEFHENRRMARIVVEDTGMGIDKEKQELLFSRFMQTHFSYDGTGVGLSLVKEFVEAHKGKVWYAPHETSDYGSVFSVEISTDPETYRGENFIPPSEPVGRTIVPMTQEDEIISNIRIDESTLSDYKMLIIDDNDDIRQFLIEELGRYFNRVDAAADGETGMQKAIELNPDLIICDVMMTGIDGFEVTRRLREDFQTCHIPIILLTAHSSTEHQLEGIQSGADAYITKPFSMKYLIARMMKLIEQREQLKKRFSNEYIIGGTLVSGTNQDQKFIDSINRIIEENLDDPKFTVGQFAEQANQSRTLFYRKMKGITGMSPNDFIKVKRLNRAAQLLLENDLTVAEVSYKVGFDDPFYFSRCFKAHYHCSPSKYGGKETKE